MKTCIPKEDYAFIYQIYKNACSPRKGMEVLIDMYPAAEKTELVNILETQMGY